MRLPTIGTLGSASGVDVGRGSCGMSGGKDTEGSGSWGRRPAEALDAGKTKRAQAAHVASAA
jgi:hypothetical protein